VPFTRGPCLNMGWVGGFEGMGKGGKGVPDLIGEWQSAKDSLVKVVWAVSSCQDDDVCIGVGDKAVPHLHELGLEGGDGVVLLSGPLA